MAGVGLSLKCGECGAQLRSGEEAQQHAEATGHASFEESTQPVLNMVCRECGKPCRSQTEMDLHTKRTGHTDFVDKTEETAKPLLLPGASPSGGVVGTKPATADAQAGQAGAAGGAGGGGSEGVVEEEGGKGSEEELVVPQVSVQLKEELESMGFSAGRCVRALYATGSSSVEAAITWLEEHENDTDIDTMPMVPKQEAGGAAAGPKLTPEEAKKLAEELREKAKKRREEEEKRLEREREKERIRVGKEMALARQKEEDEERKRRIELRRREKEEEQRARQRILQRLEEDRAERRRKLGLPPETEEEKAKRLAEAAAKEHSAANANAKAHATPTTPPVATTAERMRVVLRNLKHNHTQEAGEAKVKKAFETLLKYVSNLAAQPDNDKFRRIRLSNAAFQERVGCFAEALEFLQLCGFEREKQEDGAAAGRDASADEFLSVPSGRVSVPLLNKAAAELNSAIVNPYFGIL